MVIMQVHDRLVDERIHQPDPAAKNHARMLSLFAELFRRLKKLDAASRSTAANSSAERWHDDSFTYFEGDLAEDPHAEIDINIHNGKVYVRIAR